MLQGQALFREAGNLAGPVRYEHLALQQDIHHLPSYANRIGERVHKTIENYVRHLHKANITNAERRRRSEVEERLRGPLKRLERTGADLENVLRATAETVKRGAGLLLAGIGALLSVGSAIYTADQVATLSKKLQHEQIRLDHTLRALAEMGQKVNSWQKNNYEDKLESDIIRDLHYYLEAAALHLERIVEGIYTTLNQQLHLYLVPPAVVAELKEQANKAGKTKDLTTVLEREKQFWELKISYVIGTEGIMVICHAPFVRDSKTDMQKMFKLDNAMMEIMGDYSKYQGEQSFISVSGNMDVHTTHSAANLMLFDKVGKTYICKEGSVLHKTPSTCIAALLYNYLRGMEQKCAAVP